MPDSQPVEPDWRNDLDRDLKPLEMGKVEFGALVEAIERVLPHTKPGTRVQVPSVSHAGKPYMVTLAIEGSDFGHYIAAMAVDLKPDTSSPAFDAYIDKRAEWEKRKASHA